MSSLLDAKELRRYDRYIHYALKSAEEVPIAAGEIDGTRWSKAYNKCFLYPVESVEACVESLNKALALRFAPSNQDELMDMYGIEPWCAKVMDIYEIVMK